MRNFALKYKTALLVGAILLFVVLVSFLTLTTKPRLWIDEAKSIELALNFERFGILDIQTSPGVFSGFPHLLQSTGYPLTVPLAAWFLVFGESFVGIRIFMLVWMLAAIVAVFLFVYKIFGTKEALFASALVATFAPFHDNARTVVGEIPGFLFLVAGLVMLSSRRVLFRAGILFGLAAVTKPSVYIIALPAMVISTYFQEKGFRPWFKGVFFLAAGSLIPGILWFFVVLGNPFAVSFLSDVLLFWQNPFGGGSLWENVLQNIQHLFFSRTLLYIGALFILLVPARKYFWKRDEMRTIYVFTMLYGAFAFLYYLRSPGWLRYIIVAELLILMIMPHMLYCFFETMTKKNNAIKHYLADSVRAGACSASIILFFLITAHTVYFFTAAKIYTSDSIMQVSEYLRREFGGKSIGVLDSLKVGIFLEPSYKYQVATMVGIPQIGKNPLFNQVPPEVLVGVSGNKFLVEAHDVLRQKYYLYNTVAGYSIYTTLSKAQ